MGTHLEAIIRCKDCNPKIPQVFYEEKMFKPLGEDATFASTPKLLWHCEEQKWYVEFQLEYDNREYEEITLEEWLALPTHKEWLKAEIDKIVADLADIKSRMDYKVSYMTLLKESARKQLNHVEELSTEIRELEKERIESLNELRRIIGHGIA